MNKFTQKPHAGMAIAVVLWLLALGAVALTVVIFARMSTLLQVVMCIVPFFFVVPAVTNTAEAMLSGLSVEEGVVTYTSADKFHRKEVTVDLAEIEAVWRFRRTVQRGRHTQVASGVGLRHRDGTAMELDLSMYGDGQQVLFWQAITAMPHLTVLEPLRDNGRVYAAPLAKWQDAGKVIQPDVHVKKREEKPTADKSDKNDAEI